MHPTRYTAHVIPRDGISLRLTLMATDLVNARHAARCAAVARFPRQQIAFTVRPA